MRIQVSYFTQILPSREVLLASRWASEINLSHVEKLVLNDDHSGSETIEVSELEAEIHLHISPQIFEENFDPSTIFNAALIENLTYDTLWLDTFNTSIFDQPTSIKSTEILFGSLTSDSLVVSGDGYPK